MPRKKPHCQFFTTDTSLIRGTWYPMDHFFYAPYRSSPDGGLVEKDKVVHLEAHANVSHPNGMSVSVIHNGKSEEYDDYPAALRRMADIIEAHSKKGR